MMIHWAAVSSTFPQPPQATLVHRSKNSLLKEGISHKRHKKHKGGGTSLLCFLCLLWLISSCQSKPTMSSFVDTYFNALFEWSPSFATSTGFHEYDSKIEDLSASATNARIAKLHDLKSELKRVRGGTLTEDEKIDADIIDGQINAELLDLETIQTWRHNPMNYVGLPGSAIDNLMKRNFAPPQERLRSVTARLKGVPAIMAAMKANMENPPHEFTDLALRIAHGSVGFFKDTVAAWAKDASGGDTAL